MSLFDELKRRKVFKVGAAYLVVAWLAVQAASIGFPAFEAPPWALRIFILVVFLGLPISLVFAWAFDFTPEGLKPEQSSKGNKRFLLVAAGLAVLAFAWYFKGQPAYLDAPSPAGKATTATPAVAAPATTAAPISRKSIAVLPFTDLSPNKDQEYFSDGIAEEILNALAQVKDLKVAGRTSSFHFKGRNEDLRTIGQQLGVAHILEGSVRKQGDKVRITAQLIQTDDGFHLWSESYDGDLADVFELQENIARSITDKLQVILKGDQVQRLVSTPTSNTDAYSLYLQASQVFNRRDGAKFPQAIVQLEQAVRLDPKFARAHSRLAAMHVLSANYDPRTLASAAAATEEHARRATALDPALAEPHAALGQLYQRQRRFLDAHETSARAIALDPGDVTAAFWYATMVCTTGYLSQCDASLDRVLALDPMLPNALYWRARQYLRSGELDKAASFFQRAADGGLAHVGIGLGSLAEVRGQPQEAEKRLAEGLKPFVGSFREGTPQSLMHGVFGDAPARQRATAEVDRYLASRPTPVSGVAIYYLLRTAPARALEVALQGPSSNDAIVLGPMWENWATPIRQRPEFSRFVQKVGLAKLWDKVGAPDLCRKVESGAYACR